jgi:RimJ/RimL family protein N-acetyltransferase
MEGRLVVLERLNPAKHADSLWDAVHEPENDHLWTYLFDGPYRERAAFDEAMAQKASTSDPLFYAIIDRSANRAVGYASHMRIEPAHRVIEVGGILYTPLLQRSAGATEAMYLMARRVFEDLGYRRYEWSAIRRTSLRVGRRCGSASPTKASSGST